MSLKNRNAKMAEACVKCGLVRPTYISEPSCPKGGYHDYQERRRVTSDPQSLPDGTVKSVPVTCPTCGCLDCCTIIFSETEGVTCKLPKHWWASVKTGSVGHSNNNAIIILLGCSAHKPE